MSGERKKKENEHGAQARSPSTTYKSIQAYPFRIHQLTGTKKTFTLLADALRLLQGVPREAVAVDGFLLPSGFLFFRTIWRASPPPPPPGIQRRITLGIILYSLCGRRGRLLSVSDLYAFKTCISMSGEGRKKKHGTQPRVPRTRGINSSLIVHTILFDKTRKNRGLHSDPCRVFQERRLLPEWLSTSTSFRFLFCHTILRATPPPPAHSEEERARHHHVYIPSLGAVAAHLVSTIIDGTTSLSCACVSMCRLSG